MKRIALLATTLLAAALMAAALVGCGGQTASSASSASASGSASASAAAEQSQDEIVAELKDALANEPAYKSVTLTEATKAIPTGEADAAEAK